MTSGLAETRRPTTVPVFALMTVARAGSKIAAIAGKESRSPSPRSSDKWAAAGRLARPFDRGQPWSDLAVNRGQTWFTTNSIRRLMSRPRAVALLAMGTVSPLPTATNSSGLTPLLRRASRTAVARSMLN